MQTYIGTSVFPIIAAIGKEVADAARKAPQHLKQRFKLEVEGTKVFFDYPKPLATAVAEKTKSVSRPELIPKPRYLTTQVVEQASNLFELPVHVRSLLEKYHKKLVKIVHNLSEEEFQKRKSWVTKHPEMITGGVGVVAKKDGRFILVRHTPESWGDNHLYWAFPGGGVKPGEGLEEAAIREFKEETGLDIEILDLIMIQAHVNRSPRGEQSVFYVATFAGEVVAGEIASQKPDEIAEVKLFEELPKKELVPWLKNTEYIKKVKWHQGAGSEKM